MRDNMYENLWSPFDPLWYREAFDKYISTADQLFNQDEIIKMGYVLPDSDGSKSSVFHSDAVLNNSFNEKALRETLKDIYINNTHKLTASNHDNVHFFKWHGYMSDVEVIPNTDMCQIKIPTDSFIFAGERDSFKLSQFYRKWVSVEELMNNWKVFKWTCLLFINRRIYGDYSIRIDDHETVIRFKFEDFWMREDRNYHIYIYKFDTNFQARIKISKELVRNQWNYQLPVEYIGNKKINNFDKVVCSITKIGDANLRKDGNFAVDIMGDNIEFLSIKDGFIDMSSISDYNIALIDSELTEYLWMDIFVPKFFHEYPILLPVDVIYREYQPNLIPVHTGYSQVYNRVKASDDQNNTKQVFIDLNQDHKKEDGWKSMIRPIVLADSFDNMANDPYDTLEEELGPLRELTIQSADLIEEFRFFIRDYTTNEKFIEYCDQLEDLLLKVKRIHDTFLDTHHMPLDTNYDTIEKKFVEEVMPAIRNEGYRSKWFRSKEGSSTDFWHFVSKMVYIPRELADHYSLSNIINHMQKSNKIVWEDLSEYKDKLRFARPIDSLDFFFMEYDNDKHVWRPVDLEVEHHFPDVYMLITKDGKELTKRIFKAFFFYSDTINVLNEAPDIKESTPSWTDDMETYELHKEGIYRNIFMEKFYWMGIRSIYRGMFNTESRWESIEYVYDNESYKRFNELFLNSMDPYYKMGLSTYLKSADYEFPFDDAINKMNEGLNQKFLGYKKITNYEMYLDKTWVPSYFDYVLRILDDWEYEDRIIRRPRNTFNIDRLVPVLINIQEQIFDATNKFNINLDWILQKLAIENYNLNKPVDGHSLHLLQQLLNINFNNLSAEDAKGKKDEVIALLEEYGVATSLVSFHVDENKHLILTFTDNAIKDLRDLSDNISINIVGLNEFTKDLDLEIYSIDDVNEIIRALLEHENILDRIKRMMQIVYNDTISKLVYPEKFDIHNKLDYIVNTKLERHIHKISDMIQSFDMAGFMKATNDLASYEEYDKRNPNDLSLLGYINSFGSNAWSDSVKEVRNRLFTSTVVLYGNWIPTKSYNEKEVDEFVEQVNTVKHDAEDLKEAIEIFWRDTRSQKDQTLIDRFDQTEYLINQLYTSVQEYMNARNDMLKDFDEITNLLKEMEIYEIGDTEKEYSKSIDSCMAGILEALSYIAGTNNRQAALESLSGASNGIREWNDYLYTEKSVFDRILEVVKIPNEFLTMLERFSELLDAVIEYMETVNEKFVPDLSLPEYMDVYEIDEIEMSSGGFMNKLGEVIFVPGLGSYKITEVNENIGRVTAIADLPYRRTTFRDPCVQTNVYDSVTNGTGLGITFRALKSTHKHIIDDEICQIFLIRMNGIIYRIKRNLALINPYANNELSDVINIIQEVRNDWNSILSFYSEYMTDVKNDITEIIDSLYESISDFEDFMEARANMDIAYLLRKTEKQVLDCYKYYKEHNMFTGNYFYYDDKVRVAYNNLTVYYDNGTQWDDRDELKSLLKELRTRENEFYKKILRRLAASELKNNYNSIINEIDDLYGMIDEIPNIGESICMSVKDIEDNLNKIPMFMYKDKWYKIKNTTVAVNGSGYKIGDVIEIIPELPTDQFGNPIKEMEDVILNDVIIYQIAQVTEEGAVLKVNPLMNYALPYEIQGARNVSTRVGSGKGCVINVVCEEISAKQSPMFMDETSDELLPPQFNENDLFMFKFENIHDLDIGYEVFYDGKQIRDFIFRHVSSEDPLHPSNIDIIYLKANDVMELKNSNLYEKEEHYFVYKVDKANVVDSGAGYAVGQDVYVDTENAVIKVRIDKLDGTPTKGIASLNLKYSNIFTKSIDPTNPHSKVIKDSLNNIDDEYNVGYYDLIPSEGIEKPASLSYDGEIYLFRSQRFDDLEDGDRNKTFMWNHIDLPEGAPKGDPDFGWYLGSRVDNSQVPMSDNRWNGIMNLIPPTDPFIPDNRRLPPTIPVSGEYQKIKQIRIHNDTTGEETINASQKPETSDVLDGIIPVANIGHSEDDTGLMLPTIAPVDIFKADEQYSSETTVMFPFVLHSVANTTCDLVVETFEDLPKHMNEWPNAKIGSNVIVKNDETNCGHTMSYRLRSFVAAGYFIFDTPEIVDNKWNSFDVDWMNIDFYPDYPSLNTQFPEAPWRTSKTYLAIQRMINDKRVRQDVYPDKNHTSFIFNIKLKDLSVFNYTTKKWEDLYDDTKWKLEVYNDPENKHFGFRLIYLEEGNYDYDMILYLNKIPETQIKNAMLKRNATIDIAASLYREVYKKPRYVSINTGRHLRIRKLFPFEQKETFTIGYDEDGNFLGYEMDFKIANYMHYKNEIHLEDVKIYNRNAGRFEDLLDTRLYEVRFKNDEYVQRGYETQTTMIRSLISKSGDGFVTGNVWCWNAEYGIHVFANITANPINGGSIRTFVPTHCPNPPKDDITLEFIVYQNESQSARQTGTVTIEFHTERVEVYGDGYIHNVTNRMAPVPKEFKVICKYDVTSRATYDVIISKSPKQWTFIEPRWIMSPTFTLPDVNIQADRLYVVSDKGRFPMINPATHKPTLSVEETDKGTEVTFLNLYKKYEHFEVHSVPYPMRSIYVKRRIPSHGYLDMKGKINKPLSKKYFEFWVNGRLLDDEVTIISPTKLFLHGLKSLRNFEIIEINRDPNEYFSDNFLGAEQTLNTARADWDLSTYLDEALEGNLEGDNYTEAEQEQLLTPVWKQVERDHPEYKNYPPNVDVEDDILQRVEEQDYPLDDLVMPTYQYIITDTPTLEGKPIADRNMSFDYFGFTPLTLSDIVNILNEEWSSEIGKGIIPSHTVISDDAWYGMATRLYDEYGVRVHNLDESVYQITDPNILRVDSDTRISRIIRNNVTYDLD